MSIDEIVDRAVMRATDGLTRGSLNLRDIIYQAVNTGMADAYLRGGQDMKAAIKRDNNSA